MFHLRRYFSLISFFGILSVVVALTLFYRHLAFADMVAHEERSNSALTRSLSNALGEKLSRFIRSADGVSADRFQELKLFAAIKTDVYSLMAGQNIVKVKVFDPLGRTLFSTQVSQIGESRAGNSGFLAAISGHIASAIAFKSQVDNFDGVVADRSLVSSYVPFQNQGQVVGVIEVYSDVTDLVAALERTLWKIVTGVICCLFGLYLFLYLVVARADRFLQRSSEEIRYLAFHDALTGLPNRRSFTDRLEQILRQQPERLAVLFVDLDNFKQVNDCLGHAAGDALLKLQAQRLRQHFSSAELVARFGGDEFAVILTGETFIEGDSCELIERLNSRMSAEAEIDGQTLNVSCSVGIACYPMAGSSMDDLLRCADHAMYDMKHHAACSKAVSHEEGIV